MNTNIKDFLTPCEARQWAEYFAKECGCRIKYDYFYDNYLQTKYPTETEGRRINYPFMYDYRFGLVASYKTDIKSSVTEKHELKFHVKKKGMSFIYVVKFEPVEAKLPDPIIIDVQYKQMELSDYIGAGR